MGEREPGRAWLERDPWLPKQWSSPTFVKCFPGARTAVTPKGADWACEGGTPRRKRAHFRGARTVRSVWHSPTLEPKGHRTSGLNDLLGINSSVLPFSYWLLLGDVRFLLEMCLSGRLQRHTQIYFESSSILTNRKT